MNAPGSTRNRFVLGAPLSHFRPISGPIPANPGQSRPSRPIPAIPGHILGTSGTLDARRAPRTCRARIHCCRRAAIHVSADRATCVVDRAADRAGSVRRRRTPASNRCAQAIRWPRGRIGSLGVDGHCSCGNQCGSSVDTCEEAEEESAMEHAPTSELIQSDGTSSAVRIDRIAASRPTRRCHVRARGVAFALVVGSMAACGRSSAVAARRRCRAAAIRCDRSDLGRRPAARPGSISLVDAPLMRLPHRSRRGPSRYAL